MKPCAKNRKRIAWLAIGALEAQASRELQAHLETCEGCRQYLNEISNVTETLAATELAPDIQASESFHRRVARKLRAEQSRPAWEFLAAFLRHLPLNWRVALTALGAILLVAVALSVFVRRPGVSAQAPAPAQAALPPNRNSTLPPTLANYQFVANHSLEELDDLLTRQANRHLAPAPLYTASILAIANTPD